MHQNVTSTSEKVSELHTHTRKLTNLFNKIDQIEVRQEFWKYSIDAKFRGLKFLISARIYKCFLFC